MSQHIGIVGGGIGGLAAAIALRDLGHEITVFEQAPEFGQVGADINLTPNAVRALDGLGVGDAVRETAARPTHRISRTWDTGEETSRLEMGDTAERKYGAPQLTIHRADLLSALEQTLPPHVIHHGHRLTKLREATQLTFEHTETNVDATIGADGIHSSVRTALFGKENPEFTGVVAYRAVVPTEKLDVPNLGAFTKWWGPDPSTQIVTFPLNQGKDTFIFATTPQESWTEESWTAPGDVEELRTIYKEFHPEARALLDACDTVLKSALYVRDPLPRWSEGRATLLGDAAHPMMPFMAQGAAMAIEDGVVLARAFAAHPHDIEQALKTYEAARLPRTSRVQLGSRGNTWLKSTADADWVYAYNAWTTPLP
ncbi:salicylate hydroxylase [Actinomadura pelletieri DSM 43383]|uniref:Salicylate hydroxylase n=1 Tax=Actinomadura pelletieri DSM 43383 TaxID=1120940 RepID=A0A495QSL6_9ACTN|nr:FAD-dependent monooxygenase [Actinomadura pelletieri]RKS76504.1 salicylate hydroxylase [Actinomadura pelletieri DSM 43383]